VNTPQSRTDEKGLQDGANDVLPDCGAVLDMGDIGGCREEHRVFLAHETPFLSLLKGPFHIGSDS
jgi:hypothetical protein